ncbi:hypothetical protein CRE_03369 [Caenorhabditis remanei]|uniref:Uncharacterized protein n=1 Tax=Caenorhabditis remanei TaxID=31234 RepID=E3N666_CAERE|nr:hypothetical protein CRE_03369 [Caenorhabditis remanei]
MGLNMNSDTTKYKCEQCQPRRLPVTKSKTIRTLKKILEKLRRVAERERRNKRKSESVEPVKPVVQQPRKSAPMPLQPQPSPQRSPQRSQCNKPPAPINFIEESIRQNKAFRMFVEKNVEALVTTELVGICQVILEVNGYVAISNEMKRQPGEGNRIFMYDGLMKDTAGDMCSGHDLVCRIENF